MNKSILVSIFFIALNAQANPPTGSHFPGFPCQQKAAAIQNGAIMAIASTDVGMIALRFLQAQAGFYSARDEFFGYLAVSALAYLSDNKIVAAVIGTLSLVQVGNMIRHRQSYYLSKPHLNPQILQPLLQINYGGIKDIQNIIDVVASVTKVSKTLLNYLPARGKI